VIETDQPTHRPRSQTVTGTASTRGTTPSPTTTSTFRYHGLRRSSALYKVTFDRTVIRPNSRVWPTATSNRRVKIATLLHKPGAMKFDVTLDYVGFEIPTLFVLGYGLDYAQEGRNLAQIYVLDEDGKKGE
jgi:hypothetical protein